MPTQHANTLRAALSRNQIPTTANLTYPLTPPADRYETEEQRPGDAHSQDLLSVPDGRDAVNDNTAAGMSLLQEESLYTGHEISLEAHIADSQTYAEKEKAMVHDLGVAPYSQGSLSNSGDTPPSTNDVSTGLAASTTTDAVEHRQPEENSQADNGDADRRTFAGMGLYKSPASPCPDETMTGGSTFLQAPLPAMMPLNDNSPRSPSKQAPASADYGTKPWDFSNIRSSPHYPSSLLHPGSRFEGTQHSDRQIYNVTVTVHTVDVSQCTLSGYLKIEGLTPDHPTLTTFFTGEIIGGPDQKHSFKTRDPSWGANDKTDLMHWARFPAWKPLSRDAKRDINFVYPMPGTGSNGNDSWTQQEHIFMRWKESFLVPDHKVRSIQGASFDGFYYICFNQIEGKISGIYFHARSEKYQQLELMHEGKPGIWNKGVRPAMEFR